MCLRFTISITAGTHGLYRTHLFWLIDEGKLSIRDSKLRWLTKLVQCMVMHDRILDSMTIRIVRLSRLIANSGPMRFGHDDLMNPKPSKSNLPSANDCVRSL